MIMKGWGRRGLGQTGLSSISTSPGKAMAASKNHLLSNMARKYIFQRRKHPNTQSNNNHLLILLLGDKPRKVRTRSVTMLTKAEVSGLMVLVMVKIMHWRKLKLRIQWVLWGDIRAGEGRELKLDGNRTGPLYSFRSACPHRPLPHCLPLPPPPHLTHPHCPQRTWT